MRCCAARPAPRTRLLLTHLLPLLPGSGADGALELRAEGAAGAEGGPPAAAAGGKKRKEKEDKKDKKERKRVRHTRGTHPQQRRLSTPANFVRAQRKKEEKKRRKDAKRRDKDRDGKRDKKRRSRSGSSSSSSSSSSDEGADRGRAKRDDADAPPDASFPIAPIGEDDYFLKNHELSAWLRSTRGVYFTSLSAADARAAFREFTQLWNTRQLPRRLYEGVQVSGRR